MKILKNIWIWLKAHWPLSIFAAIWEGNKTRVLFYLALLFIAWLGTWYTYNFAINFSAIPLTFFFLLIFIGFFELFDTKILTRIDTIHELHKGNTAVSQFFIAIAILVLAVAVIVG